MNYNEGSQWRKWDLHVHTPESLVQFYSATATPTSTSKEVAWEKFITEIEQLPKEFKVLGINDYIFLDGYKKVLEYKESGRLSNIDLFLPVIEFRVDKFGGSNSKLSRVNYHIIFSNELKPEIIEAHFLNALPRKYTLSQGAAGQWSALATKESLAELGKIIKETLPEGKMDDFADDLSEGFNNFNLNIEQIKEVLTSCHYFKDRYLTAVGKTEWYDIKWNEQSIADKKTIINDADFVFISSESVDLFQRAKDCLTNALVNDLLLDCSDSHYFSDSKEKDRIGKCYTWLKADTTFEGLKQILNEKKDRVYIGDLPPKLNLIQNNKTKYINSVQIYKKSNTRETDIWFNNNITFSSDLVAIIGNKGNGKSALADIIALAGNTKNHGDFSFLTKNKFRENNLARNFEAKIIWESGIVEIPVSLDVNPEPTKLEKVKYIPQQFLEKLCNNENNKFENELKKVIFSHVGQEDRLNQNSLDELIEQKSITIIQSIDIIRNQIVGLNKKIIKLENEVKPSYVGKIEESIKNKTEELKAHDDSKPLEENLPIDAPEIQSQLNAITATITNLNKSRQDLISAINESQESLNKNKLKLAALKSLNEKLDNFEKQYEILKNGMSEEFVLLNIKEESIISSIITLKIERNIINQLQNTIEAEVTKLMQQLNPDESSLTSLLYQMKQLDLEITNLQNKLDEPNKRYQVYLSKLKQWEITRSQIVGDEEKNGTLKFYENTLSYIKSTLPVDLEKLIKDRSEKVEEIYSYISKLVIILETLYKPVQTYFSTHKLSDPDFKLNFEVILKASDFIEGFLKFINQGVKGNFYGNIEGRKKIQTLLDEVNLKNSDELIKFLNDILFLLEEKQGQSQKYEIENQLTKTSSKEDLYNYIFSLAFLMPSYGLKLGDKELSKLSPGEKGALLLMFYLLVDKDDIPLIIDQPEENLDNQSVFKMLVPAIKAAKEHRQIIMVTHNPNLAVVCDAEQIIFAKIDKPENNRIEYLSGAIENPVINQKIIDILEGTMPAFNNRDSKYFR